MALRGEGEERRCAVYIITARWHFEHRLDFNLSVAVVGGFDARWLTHPHFMLAFRYDHGGFCRDSAEILWGFFETFRARFSIFLWELFFFFYIQLVTGSVGPWRKVAKVNWYMRSVLGAASDTMRSGRDQRSLETGAIDTQPTVAALFN